MNLKSERQSRVDFVERVRVNQQKLRSESQKNRPESWSPA